MDAYDLLLLYLPYCVLKKVITCLDEVLLKHPEFLSQFKSLHSGKVLFLSFCHYFKLGLRVYTVKNNSIILTD